MELADGSHIGITQSLQDSAPSEVKLIIHNQCPGIELVSPMYVSNGAICHLSLDQRVDVGSTMQVSFSINHDQIESIGALMYKLQKKNTEQSSDNIIFSKDEAIYIQLLIIWKVNNSSKEICAVSRLIEKDCIWDRDRLMELVERYILLSIQCGPTEDTWLMRDNTVLMTSLSIAREVYYKVEMTISKTSIRDDTQRIRYIGLYRYVSMVMLVTMFNTNTYD
jgi:hypothetical protein